MRRLQEESSDGGDTSESTTGDVGDSGTSVGGWLGGGRASWGNWGGAVVADWVLWWGHWSRWCWVGVSWRSRVGLWLLWAGRRAWGWLGVDSWDGQGGGSGDDVGLALVDEGGWLRAVSGVHSRPGGGWVGRSWVRLGAGAVAWRRSVGSWLGLGWVGRVSLDGGRRSVAWRRSVSSWLGLGWVSWDGGGGLNTVSWRSLVGWRSVRGDGRASQGSDDSGTHFDSCLVVPGKECG